VKILIVEDEERTSGYLRKGLTEANFTVDVVARGDDGLHAALTGIHDIIVLDAMLPGCSGFDIVSKLRAAGNPVPVLFLTARDAVEDRVRGLDLGADDYLVKPFAFSELLARIRSILRRGHALQSEDLHVANLEIRPRQRRASRGSTKLDLTPKEFALLEVLARHEGEVLMRTYIAEQVWDMNFDGGTNVVDVHIRRLRTKVDDPFPQHLIHTVRGVGYVLDALRG
jgi:two-component system copper resistance phosphate regulon response regulator CusR